jgi:Zn-dependent M28 family amino/carboxypeptidase
MRISSSSRMRPRPVLADVSAAVSRVSQPSLRRAVESLSEPRHYQAEPLHNQRCAQWIAHALTGFGYATQLQGRYRNIVALPRHRTQAPMILVGAHYDSVPGTPGADDNASGLAALLECARLTADIAGPAAIGFVAFNREEEGLIGSTDFVEHYLARHALAITVVHVLEMVGYCRHDEGSQRTPPGLPIQLPSVGDFVGVLGNRPSQHLVDAVLTHAATYVPTLPAIGLTVPLGMETFLPVLARSDHAPFWRVGIPAIMWTDTAEFRNPNYHGATDTAETLDYDFLHAVTQLLLACLLAPDA